MNINEEVEKQKIVNKQLFKIFQSKWKIYKFVRMHIIVNGRLTFKDIKMKLNGHCKDCNFKHRKGIAWRARGSAYNDGRMNYTHVCKSCYEVEEEYWREMWEAYYDSLI